ncbi:MAG: hypothetical protein M0Q02_02885 [Candidatus Muirbacterium halophilum]|nr:hypothetical protein [Candidatus Muirbacterium halophilum]
MKKIFFILSFISILFLSSFYAYSYSGKICLMEMTSEKADIYVELTNRIYSLEEGQFSDDKLIRVKKIYVKPDNSFVLISVYYDSFESRRLYPADIETKEEILKKLKEGPKNINLKDIILNLNDEMKNLAPNQIEELKNNKILIVREYPYDDKMKLYKNVSNSLITKDCMLDAFYSLISEYAFLIENQNYNSMQKMLSLLIKYISDNSFEHRRLKTILSNAHSILNAEPDDRSDSDKLNILSDNIYKNISNIENSIYSSGVLKKYKICLEYVKNFQFTENEKNILKEVILNNNNILEYYSKITEFKYFLTGETDDIFNNLNISIHRDHNSGIFNEIEREIKNQKKKITKNIIDKKMNLIDLNTIAVNDVVKNSFFKKNIKKNEIYRCGFNVPGFSGMVEMSPEFFSKYIEILKKLQNYGVENGILKTDPLKSIKRFFGLIQDETKKIDIRYSNLKEEVLKYFFSDENFKGAMINFYLPILRKCESAIGAARKISQRGIEKENINDLDKEVLQFFSYHPIYFLTDYLIHISSILETLSHLEPEQYQLSSYDQNIMGYFYNVIKLCHLNTSNHEFADTIPLLFKDKDIYKGTGKINKIYVIKKFNDREVLYKGGIYSYFEGDKEKPVSQDYFSENMLSNDKYLKNWENAFFSDMEIENTDTVINKILAGEYVFYLEKYSYNERIGDAVLNYIEKNGFNDFLSYEKVPMYLTPVHFKKAFLIYTAKDKFIARYLNDLVNEENLSELFEFIKKGNENERYAAINLISKLKVINSENIELLFKDSGKSEKYKIIEEFQRNKALDEFLVREYKLSESLPEKVFIFEKLSNDNQNEDFIKKIILQENSYILKAIAFIKLSYLKIDINRELNLNSFLKDLFNTQQNNKELDDELNQLKDFKDIELDRRLKRKDLFIQYFSKIYEYMDKDKYDYYIPDYQTAKEFLEEDILKKLYYEHEINKFYEEAKKILNNNFKEGTKDLRRLYELLSKITDSKRKEVIFKLVDFLDCRKYSNIMYSSYPARICDQIFADICYILSGDYRFIKYEYMETYEKSDIYIEYLKQNIKRFKTEYKPILEDFEEYYKLQKVVYDQAKWDDLVEDLFKFEFHRIYHEYVGENYIKRFPESQNGYVALINLYIGSKEYDNVKKYISIAKKRIKNNIEMIRAEIIMFYHLKEYDKVFNIISQNEKKFENDGDINCIKHNILLKNDKKKSYEFLETLIRKFPENLNILQAYIESYSKIEGFNDGKKAVLYVDKLSRLTKEKYGALVVKFADPIAAAYAESGNFDEAYNIQNQIAKFNDNEESRLLADAYKNKITYIKFQKQKKE